MVGVGEEQEVSWAHICQSDLSFQFHTQIKRQDLNVWVSEWVSVIFMFVSQLCAIMTGDFNYSCSRHQFVHPLRSISATDNVSFYPQLLEQFGRS